MPGGGSPLGGEPGKNDTKCVFERGGVAPPSGGEKTRPGAVSRGACRPWGASEARHVPPFRGDALAQ